VRRASRPPPHDRRHTVLGQRRVGKTRRHPWCPRLSHIGPEVLEFSLGTPPPLSCLQNPENKGSILRLCARSLSLQELYAKSREHGGYAWGATWRRSSLELPGSQRQIVKEPHYPADNVLICRLSDCVNAVNDNVRVRSWVTDAALSSGVTCFGGNGLGNSYRHCALWEAGIVEIESAWTARKSGSANKRGAGTSVPRSRLAFKERTQTGTGPGIDGLRMEVPISQKPTSGPPCRQVPR
jgi:hypothetical protein